MDAKQVKIGPRMVPPKGSWYTPQQRSDAFMCQWQKLTSKHDPVKKIPIADQITYFGFKRVIPVRTIHDILFQVDLDFDKKATRCDRHSLDIVRDHVYNEERKRVVPVSTAQIYGHRLKDLEGKRVADHRRKDVMSGTYRRCGLNLKPQNKLLTQETNVKLNLE